MQLRFASKIRAVVGAGAVALGVIGMVSAAQAQTPVGGKIPFAFDTGTRHFEPGEYRVTMITDHVMQIQNTDTLVTDTVMTNAEEKVNASDTGKLVFHRYGNRYFLSQVWAPGAKTGRSLIKTRAEKEVQIAAENPTRGNVTLALNRLPGKSH